MIDARDVGGSGEMDASLQPLEAGRTALLVERDDLAVEDSGARSVRRRLLERADERRELRRLLVAEAGPDADCRRRFVPAAISTSARMPSYFGS